ncbi:MAG: hypothetical protein H7222_02140 [Methylotenera sp.]|nr:hypothetical protein [Oligoflexia bacterium]
MTDALVNATEADVALHVPAFTYPFGTTLGTITRENIMAYYSRVYDLNHRQCRTLWRGWMPGWRFLLLQKLGKATGGFLLYAPYRRKINPLRYHEVAFPEGLALVASV